MNRAPRIAILLSLVEKLKENGSWCGETHIQKSTYILQEMLGVGLEYNFILYKHGPFSFDLSDELGSLRADSLLNVIPQHPYGPRLLPTEEGKNLKEKLQKTVDRYKEKIDCAAQWLGSKKVVDLEKIATAFFVTKENSNLSPQDRAEGIRFFKPHIPFEDALSAIDEVDTHIVALGHAYQTENHA